MHGTSNPRTSANKVGICSLGLELGISLAMMSPNIDK